MIGADRAMGGHNQAGTAVDDRRPPAPGAAVTSARYRAATMNRTDRLYALVEELRASAPAARSA